MKKTDRPLARRHLLAIVKSEETYLVAFDESDIKQAVAQVIRYAVDTRLSFNYSDLLSILRQMKRLIPNQKPQRLHL